MFFLKIRLNLFDEKEITEQSGLLQHLLPGISLLYLITNALKNNHIGDVVLADRGFTVDECARMAMAEVKIPPFTKGKKQLEKIEVDWSRELSLVHIHVERVIGVLKQKYTILQGTLALKLIQHENEEPSTIDKIVTVCCACVNVSFCYFTRIKNHFTACFVML